MAVIHSQQLAFTLRTVDTVDSDDISALKWKLEFWSVYMHRILFMTCPPGDDLSEAVCPHDQVPTSQEHSEDPAVGSGAARYIFSTKIFHVTMQWLCYCYFLNVLVRILKILSFNV